MFFLPEMVKETVPGKNNKTIIIFDSEKTKS